MLCGDLMRREAKTQGLHVADSLTVQQKLAQHWKATILQKKFFLSDFRQYCLKKKKNKTNQAIFMNLKTQTYEDKAPPSKRSVWYQRLYRRKKEAALGPVADDLRTEHP